MAQKSQLNQAHETARQRHGSTPVLQLAARVLPANLLVRLFAQDKTLDGNAPARAMQSSLYTVSSKVSMLLRIRTMRKMGLDLAWNVCFEITPDTKIAFGNHCRILHGSLLSLERGELSLGTGTLLGQYSNVRAVDSFVRIGSHVQLAQFVSLIAANHKLGANGVPLWHEHDVDPGQHGVIVGDDCWLGAGAVILPGVELGPRSVVGAGAVVTRSFPAGTKLVGVPASAVP